MSVPAYHSGWSMIWSLVTTGTALPSLSLWQVVTRITVPLSHLSPLLAMKHITVSNSNYQQLVELKVTSN